MDDQDLEIVRGVIPFKIYSGLLRAYRGADGKLRLKGVASSTVKDRHGDTMERTALEDMVTAANDNMTIFLNHSYDVPEDVAGSVDIAKMFERGSDNVGNPIWDLDFDVIVNESNPRAIKSFEAIEGGTKLGLSIGAMIPEGGALRNKKTGAYTFRHVDLLETSIVGIPANPRSWISNAIKALKSTSTFQTDSPTVTLDDDGSYEIKGRLSTGAVKFTNGTDNFEIGTTTEIEVTEADSCGAPCAGGHCKKPSGHDGGHSSSQSKSAETDPHASDQDEDADEELDDSEAEAADAALATPDDPEVQDAKIQVITIDTDDPKGSTDDSQGASGSDPDDESDDDAYESTPSADVSLTTTLTESLASLEATASALVEVQRQLDVAIEERDAARRERDEISTMAQQVITETSRIIEKLANMPVGRKAVLREAQDDLSGLERIYGPEILKLIRR